jgi:hypothetical protein
MTHNGSDHLDNEDLPEWCGFRFLSIFIQEYRLTHLNFVNLR